MKAIKYVSIVSLFFFCVNIIAQQQPLYNQYLLNYYLVNPAAAGSEGYTSFDLTARQQWVGFEGSPTTFTISAQSRLLKAGVVKGSTGKSSYGGSRSGRVGVGGYMYNDKNGALGRTGLQLSYAYHIYVGGTQVSMGITGSAYQIRIDKSMLDVVDPDPAMDALQNSFVPDANIGVFVLNNNLYGGLSVTQLFQEYLSYLSDYNLYRNYYLMGGYRIYVNQGVYIEPSIIAKLTEDKKYTDPLSGVGKSLALNAESDFTLKASFNEMYWVGAGYRTRGAMIFLAGMKITRIYFTYAFDFPSGSDIKTFSYGSHEIMLALKLGDSVRRYRYLDRY